MAIRIVHFVYRHPTNGELNRLPGFCIEAPQENLFRVPFTAFVRQEDSGRQLQQLFSAARREHGHLADVDLKVATTSFDLPLAAHNGDL